MAVSGHLNWIGIVPIQRFKTGEAEMKTKSTVSFAEHVASLVLELSYGIAESFVGFATGISDLFETAEIDGKSFDDYISRSLADSDSGINAKGATVRTWRVFGGWWKRNADISTLADVWPHGITRVTQLGPWTGLDDWLNCCEVASELKLSGAQLIALAKRHDWEPDDINVDDVHDAMVSEAAAKAESSEPSEPSEPKSSEPSEPSESDSNISIERASELLAMLGIADSVSALADNGTFKEGVKRAKALTAPAAPAKRTRKQV